MKIEKGVMVMKDGKAWGKTYEDGRCTEFGWMDPEDAEIHNPDFVKKPADLTYKGSHHTEELSKGKVVRVERRTEVVIVGESS
jgi:hypothetical protein